MKRLVNAIKKSIKNPSTKERQMRQTGSKPLRGKLSKQEKEKAEVIVEQIKGQYGSVLEKLKMT